MMLEALPMPQQQSKRTQCQYAMYAYAHALGALARG
jgi:hypothetical protein